MKTIIFSAVLTLFGGYSYAQDLLWEGKKLELRNVNAAIVDFRGEQVLKVERDLQALPFDEKNLASTVDEPTFVKLKDFDLRNGVIEVKVLSTIQQPSPFAGAR
ncbi:MAG: hypothetical protein WBJ10_12475, partial [Daejeonella sp.]